ncbi:MAG: serine hydrolase [Hydrotalea flava]|nr:serine hydrolase [Hydrotalea flava]NIM37178.1 serine hydrolase [Hydrotalea flava]NIN02371.1 serine hydrolase [Hydrotalea flava]NIN14023.1 serine hydrolase [Hydrotalea flava]NIO93104.1 serine hydrolase [Hydrotalea flava]
MQKIFYAFISFFFVLYAESQTAKQKNVLIHTIDSILQSQVKQQFIPGAVVLIKKDGKVVYQQAYGYARMYSNDHQLLAKPEKMQLNTMFDLASLTKVIGTTTAIMYLADRHLLSVNDPVSKYVADFNTPDKKNITIRNLLTHTSGIDEWYPLFYRAHNRQQVFSLTLLNYPYGTQLVHKENTAIWALPFLAKLFRWFPVCPLSSLNKKKYFIPLTCIILLIIL